MTSTLKPQPGFQTDFLTSKADIVIGGGAAGVGKTFAELLEPLYHKHVKGFTCIFFRRTSVQIRNLGGLWEKSHQMYSPLGGKAREQQMDWVWPSGAVIKFSHLEYENNVFDHQGSEYCLIVFDELTHFTKKQFFYMLSRNRSTCGVKPYIRATCNPDPDSFVAELIDWWIDEDGWPIKERNGVLRYFLNDSDNLVWGATVEEVLAQCVHMPKVNKNFVKSITFIAGNLDENKRLMEVDPGYVANLMALPEEEKIRLLEGNWRVRTDELGLFEYQAIDFTFDNEYPLNLNNRYITCDAARLGNDFTVIMVWQGWKVVKMVIITKNDANEGYQAIEKERIKFGISKAGVIVDQDGVGSGIVKLGNYTGFGGGLQPLPVKEAKENYANRKTQFYFRLSEIVNKNGLSLCLNSETVIIDGVYGIKMKYRGKVVDVRDFIKQDLRAIKKAKADMDGKFQINPKSAQKILLKGRSPDFGDTLSLRINFELTKIGFVTGTVKNINNYDN